MGQSRSKPARPARATQKGKPRAKKRVIPDRPPHVPHIILKEPGDRVVDHLRLTSRRAQSQYACTRTAIQVYMSPESEIQSCELVTEKAKGRRLSILDSLHSESEPKALKEAREVTPGLKLQRQSHSGLSVVAQSPRFFGISELEGHRPATQSKREFCGGGSGTRERFDGILPVSQILPMKSKPSLLVLRSLTLRPSRATAAICLTSLEACLSHLDAQSPQTLASGSTFATTHYKQQDHMCMLPSNIYSNFDSDRSCSSTSSGFPTAFDLLNVKLTVQPQTEIRVSLFGFITSNGGARLGPSSRLYPPIFFGPPVRTGVIRTDPFKSVWHVDRSGMRIRRWRRMDRPRWWTIERARMIAREHIS
ncbi:hypothetical protein C8R47DRAFT_1080546 [Mycena vitilis]|nr:hypothetical protein C8R47DRAFT_1080546 [Mycena vitilis]